MPVTLPSNEYSEHNESVGNFSEIEEDQTDNNLIEDNFDDTNSSFIEPTPQQWTSSTKSSSFQKKKRPVGLEDVNKAALDFFSKKKKSDHPDPEDVDLCFFKSLLPDMRLMTPDQKRRFKVRVLNEMGNILNEPIPATLTGQNLYNSGFDREFQNTENRIIYSTTPSSLSSSSTSMPISPPMNLVQQSTSPQLNQNNTQNWSYQ